MKLNEVNQRLDSIRKLSEVDMDGALSLLRKLLKQLMEDDTFFVLASPNIKEADPAGFLPYIAPIQNLPYLRVFTERTAAEDFCEKAAIRYPIIPLQTVQMVKLCKYWLLMGAEGYILNDGHTWTAVTFEQFLSVFYEDVLERDEAIDPDYLPLVKTCLSLDRGETFFIQKGGVVGTEKGEPLSLDALPPDKTDLTIHNIKTTAARLRAVWQEMSRIRAEKSGLTLTGEDGVYSLSPDETYPFLDLDPFLLVAKTPDAEPEQENPEKPSIKIPKLPKLPEFRKPEIHTGKLPILIASLLLVLILGYAGSGVLSGIRFGNLCTDREYQEAAQYYQGKKNVIFRLSANDHAERVPLEILNMYMEQKMSVEESTAALAVISSIPSAVENAGTVKTRIDRVELSRNAYEAGAHTDQVINRLYYWLSVVEEDAKHYGAVQTDIEKNGDKYRGRVTRLMSALIQNGKRGQAKWCLEILKKWFPDASYEDWDPALEDVELVPMDIEDVSVAAADDPSMSPIEIYGVKVSSPDAEGYVDLYIQWKNTGTKTIQEIIFYTLPLDNFGSVLSSKRDGNYSLYGARDVGPYKPGKGTPTNSWAWEKAWSNSMISAAEVQQVIIFYTDGSVKSVEDPSKLQK